MTGLLQLLDHEVLENKTISIHLYGDAGVSESHRKERSRILDYDSWEASKRLCPLFHEIATFFSIHEEMSSPMWRLKFRRNLTYYGAKILSSA
jgi:hypothetical protein